MDYEQFKAEYRPVFDALDTNKPSADFAPDVARLKDLAASIENRRDRRSAENRRSGSRGRRLGWPRSDGLRRRPDRARKRRS